MEEFLGAAAKVTVLVFVVSSMFTAGLGLSVSEVVAPLRRIRLVALALVANFVVAPGVAWAITELISLNRAHAIGLLLLGGAAGAPFLPKLAEAAKGDQAFAVGVMLLLTAGSVAFMPLALPLMIPGLAADPWPILKPLLLTMLLPLAVGVATRRRSEGWAVRLRRRVVVVSNVSMLLAVALLVGTNFEALVGTLGSGAPALGMVFVAITLAAGYSLGGPSPDTRSVVGLGTGQRNVAAALVVAGQNFADPGVVVMILVTTLGGLVILLFAARHFARREAAADRARQPIVGGAVPSSGEPVAEEVRR